MNFVKMHGLGNDFVLVDGFADAEGAEQAAEHAVRLCDRHFGIGADGVLLVLPGKETALRMRIVNPDGSEAEMCGNAMRCLALYVHDRGLTEAASFPVETLAGVVRPTLNEANGRVASISVDMGRPRLEAAEVPVKWHTSPVVEEPLEVGGRTFEVTCLSMGNPHCVTYVAEVEAFPVAEIGPQIEHHPAFPERVNVEFAEMVDGEEVRVRVWERGAGETLACGTGASAVTVASALTGRTGRRVRVTLPGGTLEVEWAADDHVIMTGPAEYVFEGRISL